MIIWTNVLLNILCIVAISIECQKKKKEKKKGKRWNENTQWAMRIDRVVLIK
jgi:hypothetical protein